MRLQLAAAAFAALISTAAAEDAAPADRYVAPNGTFSIATLGGNGVAFHAKPPVVNGDFTIVDFPSLSSANLPLAWGRTIEWIRLDKPIDPMQWDAQATGLVSGYLESRFGAARFPISDRGKFRDAKGRLVYAFAAKGELDQMPAQWQGVVMFFDGGVAMVSEVVSQPVGDAYAPKNGIQSQDLVNWALTLRPGG
jgi:hypothetical protein